MDPHSLLADADSLLADRLGLPLAQTSTALVGSPWRLPPHVRLGDLKRLSTIRHFLTQCLEIFRESLEPTSDGELRDLLLNNAPASMREDFHRGLPDQVYSIPLFFRTDESADGQIFEIQCPGSGWGDLILLRRVFESHGAKFEFPDVVSAYAADLRDAVPSSARGVMHLLDASSNPRSMHYFIRETSDLIPYWGMAPNVSYGGCRFVRGHSAFGLVAENLFVRRLAFCEQGELQFDLPPIVLFDQKIPLALPFHEKTRDRFSDEVRRSIVFTSIATTEGFHSPEGEWVPFDGFEKRPADKRRFVFKYAGFDSSENWGSRGVRFGSDEKFSQDLRRIRLAIAKGRPWIVQPELSHLAEVLVVDREPAVASVEVRHVKLSRFYGPNRYYGAKVMASPDPVVHGQRDTAVTIAVGA